MSTSHPTIITNRCSMPRLAPGPTRPRGPKHLASAIDRRPPTTAASSHGLSTAAASRGHFFVSCYPLPSRENTGYCTLCLAPLRATALAGSGDGDPISCSRPFIRGSLVIRWLGRGAGGVKHTAVPVTITSERRLVDAIHLCLDVEIPIPEAGTSSLGPLGAAFCATGGSAAVSAGSPERSAQAMVGLVI